MLFSLKNRTAIITGASRGIGLGIAKMFAEQGANLHLVATNQEKIEAIAKEIADEYGVSTWGWACDVSKNEQVESVVKKMAELSPIDILVNNAGITKDGLLMRMSPENFDKVLQVNLYSVFYFSKAVIRSLMKSEHARVINIGSIIGVRGQAGQANYSTSKAGMIGFTKSYAREFAKKGITCNVIAPGFIQSSMTDAMTEDQIKKIVDGIPSQMMGTTKDVAALATYLASKESSYLTGQVLSIDGGLGI